MKARYLRIVFFFAVLSVPMDLLQWKEVRIPRREASQFQSVSEKIWQIQSNGTASGKVYFFEKPIFQTDFYLSWKWRVSRFPDVNPSIPLTRKEDDYALRIGVLFSDGKHRMKVPAEMRGATDRKISYVVFYSAVPKKNETLSSSFVCGVSAYHSKIYSCLHGVNDQEKKEKVFPIQDLLRQASVSSERQGSIQAIGLWVFADSDNSKSKSEAWLSELTTSF